MAIDEKQLMANLGEILVDKPMILQKLLLVFLHKREDLFKRWL